MVLKRNCCRKCFKDLEEWKLTGAAGLVAIAGFELKLSSLLAFSVQLYFLVENTILAPYLPLCVRLTGFLSAKSLAVHGCLPARPPARLLGAL